MDKVVYCTECKHRTHTDEGMYCGKRNFKVDGQFYCADGEKKDENSSLNKAHWIKSNGGGSLFTLFECPYCGNIQNHTSYFCSNCGLQLIQREGEKENGED